MTGATFSGGFESSREQEEVEVPEEVETMLEELFKGLQDRVSSTTIHICDILAYAFSGYNCQMVSCQRGRPRRRTSPRGLF